MPAGPAGGADCGRAGGSAGGPTGSRNQDATRPEVCGSVRGIGEAPVAPGGGGGAG
ncbi:hypothetical protein FRAHR75_800018 [Frankia sp. Hr75.2]|nr:hypothetical protein FRAHR75_800018 [Frankia sp. Hr75.2]